MTHKTNAQKVHELMTRSPAGPLMQAFVLEAIRHYAEEILCNDPPEDNPRALVTGQAWYTCAEVAYMELKNEH